MDQEALLERARAVASAHYDLLVTALGARRIRAVWLVGSAMLGDLTPASDIDTVTVTDSALGVADQDALTRVHTELAAEFPAVRYDTTYVAEAALARPPEPGLVVPQSLDGQLILDQPGGELHPVTWFALPHAVPVVGREPHEVSIAADRSAAVMHARHNLPTYWKDSVADGIRAGLAGRPPAERLEHPGTVIWAVLGAPRLRMFLDPAARYAGPIPSKSEAGQWVIEHHPAYAELTARALAARRTEQTTFTVGDALTAADLVDLMAARVE